MKVIEKHGLKYLAPMEKKEKIKRIANSKDGVNEFYHTKYGFGKEKAITNLFSFQIKSMKKRNGRIIMFSAQM